MRGGGVITEVLGDSPKLRVLEFLILNMHDSFSIVDLKNKSKIGYSTLKIILPELLKEELILIERIVGKAKLYKIDETNIWIQSLIFSMEYSK